MNIIMKILNYIRELKSATLMMYLGMQMEYKNGDEQEKGLFEEYNLGWIFMLFFGW